MSNLCKHGGTVYSYETCIIDKLPDGRTIGNVTKYSRTTSKHQKQVGVHSCDIRVDNVPRGTDRLTHLVEANPPLKV